VFDSFILDTKNSVGVNSGCTEEISFNAVAVKWNPRDSPVKVGHVLLYCSYLPLILNNTFDSTSFDFNNIKATWR